MTKAYPCPYCLKQNSSKDGLVAHVAWTHPHKLRFIEYDLTDPNPESAVNKTLTLRSKL
jgi:hypothetical protein